MSSHRIFLFIFILASYLICPAFADTSSKNFNPEEYVFEKVEKGDVADLRIFPENSRILKADFLRELLMGSLSGLRVTEKGINIFGVRIKEKIDFRNSKISFPVALRVCIFEKDIDFSQTIFSMAASFSKTTFFGGAYFLSATFSEWAYFKEANFSEKAVFSEAKFSGEAYFFSAKYSEETDFSRATFSGMAGFSEANFSGESVFSWAKFSEGADFSEAYLHEADLSGADLGEGNLSGADLKNCLLWNVQGFPLNYEPKAGSPPYIPSIANLPNLYKLTFKNHPHGLVDLREGFKKLGYREQERKITYAIKHTQRHKLWNDQNSSIWNKLESMFYLIFFEWPCAY